MSIQTTDNATAMKIRNHSGNADLVTVERASGNVGIGCTPASKLDIDISTDARGYFSSGIGEVGSGNFALQVTNSAGSALKPLGFRAEDIRFATGGSERMRISSSGSVGIGVIPETWQSTIDALQVGLGASFAGNTTNPSRAYLSANYYVNSSNQESYLATDEASQYFQNAGTHTFKVAPSGTADSAISWTTAMTVDNSGNLLVGTANTLPAESNVEGIALSAGSYGGLLSVSRAGNRAATFNRTTSDGDIIQFRKDGTTVGSIGSNSGYMVIGSPVGTDAHLLIGNGLIHPATSTGSAKDNAIDIGGSSNRFKDLYLSSGVYLGGTGAANKLDDYEEGAWTPVIKAVGNGGNNATYTLHGGSYTKVGRLVNVQVYISGININAITAGSYITLQGFPFACTNYADFTIAYKSGSWSTAGNIIGGYLQSGQSYAYFMRADGLEAQQTSTDVTMTKAMINITYQAS